MVFSVVFFLIAIRLENRHWEPEEDGNHRGSKDVKTGAWSNKINFSVPVLCRAEIQSNSGKSYLPYMISQIYMTITLLRRNENKMKQYVRRDQKVSQ